MNHKEWQKVKMFRCVQDPMIGPKPKNAFMLPDSPGWEAWYHVPSGSVHVKTDKGRSHVVPTGNLSSVEIEEGEGKDGAVQAEHGAVGEEVQKTRPGRPKKD